MQFEVTIENLPMAKAARTKKKAVSGKRELISPNSDKRYVKRDAQGRFKESDDQSRSLSRDKKTNAKTKVKPGYGDRGDR